MALLSLSAHLIFCLSFYLLALYSQRPCPLSKKTIFLKLYSILASPMKPGDFVNSSPLACIIIGRQFSLVIKLLPNLLVEMLSKTHMDRVCINCRTTLKTNKTFAWHLSFNQVLKLSGQFLGNLLWHLQIDNSLNYFGNELFWNLK